MRKTTLLLFSAFLCCTSIQSALALSCREGTSQNGPIEEDIILNPIYIPKEDFIPGALLWHSSVLTTTFTCFDTDDHPEGEDAFIYWNPTGILSQLPKGLAIGVSLNGNNYDNINQYQGLKGPDLGPGTLPTRGDNFWDRAIPQTINLSFSVYIKATGQPIDAPINMQHSISLFQIDGEGGLNSKPNSNFNLDLDGINNIHVIDCQPQIKINGNEGNTINFGGLVASHAKSGQIESTVPFNITADLVGGNCAGQFLAITFTAPTVGNENNMLIPKNNGSVGIYISNNNGTSIPFNILQNFGGKIVNGEHQIIQHYIANLKWLTNRPSIGVFNASAIATITFR